MAKIKKALDGRDAHITTLRVVIGALVLALFFTVHGWSGAPDRIKIDIPPDLRSGSTRGIDERHPFNIYAFGYYIFQQLNNWPVDGKDDYKERIRQLSCYITPEYKAWLERDYDRRIKKHELTRTRAAQEMPERPYSPKRVYTESGDSWVSYYDLNIKENFRGETIKDIFVRFPIRVVRWDVNPECNMWGLALDGYYKNPSRLEGHLKEEMADTPADEIASR